MLKGKNNMSSSQKNYQQIMLDGSGRFLVFSHWSDSLQLVFWCHPMRRHFAIPNKFSLILCAQQTGSCEELCKDDMLCGSEENLSCLRICPYNLNLAQLTLLDIQIHSCPLRNMDCGIQLIRPHQLGNLESYTVMLKINIFDNQRSFWQRFIPLTRE